MDNSAPWVIAISWLVSWSGVSVLTVTLIGIGFGVLGMTPPQYVFAQVCFTISAAILSVRIAWWLAIEQSSASIIHRGLLSLITFGVIGVLLCESLAWIQRLQVHLAPIVSIQLMPAVDEERPESVIVQGALIIFANNTSMVVKDFSKLLMLPPIKSAVIPERHKGRLVIISGNKEGSTFLHLAMKELRVDERHYAEVTFLSPQAVTSADAWGRQFGYTGENVMVYRIFVGPEQSVQH